MSKIITAIVAIAVITAAAIPSYAFDAKTYAQQQTESIK